MIIKKLNLQLFNNTNVTTDSGMSDQMKTFYSNYLIEYASPVLVHDQFAQMRDIPKNGGKTIEFRKYTPFAKNLTALTEGVTPDGKKLDVTTLTATISQYGDYVELSDVLILTAIDNNLLEATKLLGYQAGETLDTVTREVLNGGTAVIYGGARVSRATLTATDKLTVDMCYKAARMLKKNKAKKIDGYYVAIIHPDTAYDLMRSDEWVDAHKYAEPSNIYTGEIGRIAGIRFVETTEAKIFAGQGAGAEGSKIDVYSTLVMGADAYGTTKVTGGGLQQITKALGSGGTADPLNQRATAGWKAIKTAVRLVEGYLVRLETGSTFNSGAN